MYKASLDGVRAFCIFFTICNHIKGAPAFINGGVGVDVFFALSGFLITTLLIAEDDATGRISLSAFYLRRLFRIAPLYYLAIALYFAASHALGSQGASAKGMDAFERSFWWLVTFNKEYQPETGGTGVFGHAWTLGIEEKFYIVWPFFVYWFGTRRRLMLAAVASLAVVVILCTLASFSELTVRGYAGLTFGTVTAIVVRRRPAIAALFAKRRLAAPALAAGTLGYVLLMQTGSAAGSLLISLSGAVLVASLWCNGDQRIARFLSLRPLAYAGTLTYAIYLIHVLMINVVGVVLSRLGVPQNFYLVFAVSYAASVVAAGLLHRAVEMPLIKVGKRLAMRSAPRPLSPAG